jgi:hypothetical protein
MAHATSLTHYSLDAFVAASGFPKEFAPFAKYEFDKHLLYYGEHFSHGYDRKVPGRIPGQYARELMAFFWRHQKAIDQALAAPTPARTPTPVLFSNAYFSWDQALSGRGVRVDKSPWTAPVEGDPLSVALFSQCSAVVELFKADFAVFYAKEFHDILRAAVSNLERFYAAHPAQGILMPYTNGFFEGISTALFRRQGKRSFLCIHGIPMRLDWWAAGEHPVDAIVVWGAALKRRLVATGRPEETVLVSGHPEYSGRPAVPIASSLDRVLVLTYPQSGAPMLDTPYYHDRGLSLDYLWRVQECLKRVGVRLARVRPHPSESKDWYQASLDAGFWEVDRANLAESLGTTSVVVGPTSTVLLDAAVRGVNYVGFSPSLPHYNPLHDAFFSPDLPFDGADDRFPVAHTEEDLTRLLRDGARIRTEAVADYIAPVFRPEVILERLSAAAAAGFPVPIPPFRPAPATPPPPPPVATAPAPARQTVIPEVTQVPATAWELQTLARVRPFTMTPNQVVINAMRGVEFVEHNRIAGAVVECGVWRGGVSMAMLHQLLRLRGDRAVYLYDTFDGMSEPTEHDLAPSGESARKLLAEHAKDEANHYWAYAPIERVRKNVESVGYPMERVHLAKGKVEDTIPGTLPGPIALLRLDTDWYESTKHELIHLYPLLVSGGVLILDDYGFWQGARKAVDEFFATLHPRPVLTPVKDEFNSCVHWCVKP